MEQMEILRAQFEHLLAVVFLPLVLLSVPSRFLDQFSVSFVPQVDSRPAAFVLSIQVTKVTIFALSLSDVYFKLLCVT